jgi:cold shock protein
MEAVINPAVEGEVKWFDPVRGFGFIISATGGPDILLHANVLRNYGQSSVVEGTIITVRVQETERGIQAVEVVNIQSRVREDGVALDDIEIEDYSHIEMEPARVKWFDKVKGFGFVNVHGVSEDVFVHMDVLRRSGFAELQPGEAISVRLGESDRGAMALEVLSWDAALED